MLLMLLMLLMSWSSWRTSCSTQAPTSSTSSPPTRWSAPTTPSRSRARRYAATIPHQTFMIYQLMFATLRALDPTTEEATPMPAYQRKGEPR